MLIVAKEFAKPLKEGTQDVQELADYLMKNNSDDDDFGWMCYKLLEVDF